MRNPCLDEGILQSYTDGELEPQMLEQVVSHLASCATCTEAAQTIESEMEFATEAFAHEMTLSVPTERLRARLDEAIGGLQVAPAVSSRSAGSRWREWFASFVPSLNFVPQRALGFASLAVFFVLAAVVGGIVMRERGSQTEFVAVNVRQDDGRVNEFLGPQENTVVPEAAAKNGPASTSRKSMTRARANAPAVSTETEAVNMQHAALPGEKNYLQAISVLTDAIEANGESSLKPTLLADYKRNLAVVDQAITATQRTARTNPKSTDAAEMLYAAYQSKLELLSAVAEQSKPLVAQR